MSNTENRSPLKFYNRINFKILLIITILILLIEGILLVFSLNTRKNELYMYRNQMYNNISDYMKDMSPEHLFSDEQISLRIKEYTRNIALMVLLIVFVVVIGTYIIIRKILLRPIMRIHHANLALAKNDNALTEIKEEDFPDDEIGMIMHSRKEMLDNLEQSRQEMLNVKNQIERQNRELEKAKLEAEAASRTKSAFLANMSHELRTPLNAVIGFSEVLRDQYFGKINDKQQEYVRDILESGKHLLSLINDILDLSKVEAGKVELEISKVKIKILLENSFVMIKEKALNHGIDLVLNIPDSLSEVEIQADERKLKQVIFNLLSNAAKFTPDGGEIILSARYLTLVKDHLETQDAQILTIPVNIVEDLMTHRYFLEISVKDTGVGLGTEDQEKVFEEFYQVQGGTTDKSPGTGLGLPLSKKFIELHNGRIWAESEGEEKGSVFIFILPVIKP
jgi:signal transduction histidine kinase